MFSLPRLQHCWSHPCQIHSSAVRTAFDSLGMTLVLVTALSCKSLGPKVDSNAPSKLLAVSDDTYLLKLSHESGSDPTVYHFETCYKDGSKCVDAFKYVTPGEDGSYRVRFTKSRLPRKQSELIAKDLSQKFKSRTGKQIAGQIAREDLHAFKIAPKTDGSHLSLVLKDLVSDPQFRGGTIGDAKKRIRRMVASVKEFGLDPSILNLGKVTQSQIGSRVEQLVDQKGHIFSAEFAEYLKKQAPKSLERSGLKAKDVLSFQSKASQFKLGIYLEYFLKSKEISTRDSFDIRILLDDGIADDYLAINQWQSFFTFMYLRKKVVVSKSLYIEKQPSHMVKIMRGKSASDLIDDIRIFYTSSGVPEPIMDGLNNISRRHSYGMSSWHSGYNQISIAEAAGKVEETSQPNKMVFSDLILTEPQLTAMIVASSLISDDSLMTHGIEQTSLSSEVFLKYPSLMDSSSALSQDTVSDLFSILSDLALLVQRNPVPTIQICTPDKCVAPTPS